MKNLRAHLRYFALDALDEWRHSPGVNLLATTTLTAALFVGGLVLLVLANLELNLQRWQDDLRIQVYLLDGLESAQRTAIETSLTGMAGVVRVEYVDKASALERFRRSFGETVAGLAGDLQSNPLPASFEVYLDPAANSTSAAETIAATLSTTDGVEEVRFDAAWLQRWSGLLRAARFAGVAAAAVVFAAVVLVMASVLRLAVYARRDEIEIVQLVGATPAFVRGPFIVAGLAQGLIGALLAVVLVEGLRRLVLDWTASDPVALLTLIGGHGLPWTHLAAIVLTGLFVGFVGSYFAVRASLSFE